MEDARARELLSAEKVRLQGLIRDETEAGVADRAAADAPGDMSDGAEPLTDELNDDTIKAGISARLAAVERAEERLEAGTFGRSIRSGRPIPDERLETDPAAELTVDEANE